MRYSLKVALLLFGFTVFVMPEIDVINVPIIGRTVNFSKKVSAQTAQVYIPPAGPSRTSRTKGAGSRGCDQSGNTNLQLLVPHDHLPLTVSARPTFFWYVSNTTLPVRFTLVEPGVAKPIVDRSFKVKRPGIVELELPSDVPGLALGKEYRWTVSLVCNKERPSENSYADSSIKRIAITPELAQTLAEAGQEPQKRSLVYARSGIWYDALNSSYISYRANPQGKVTFWYFSKLLSQVGMPTVSTRQLQQPNTISNQ
jgi:Domain of Unknown Function (DUF928)